MVYLTEVAKFAIINGLGLLVTFESAGCAEQASKMLHRNHNCFKINTRQTSSDANSLYLNVSIVSGYLI